MEKGDLHAWVIAVNLPKPKSCPGLQLYASMWSVFAIEAPLFVIGVEVVMVANTHGSS